MTESIPVHTAAERLASGAILLDVREAEEWNAGHALGARWLPMSEITERHTELPTDQDICVICRSGGRSAQVTDALNAWGYRAINVDGGSLAWASEGLAFIDADGNPGTIS
jgi:rhodanese-related sulfurtransferase